MAVDVQRMKVLSEGMTDCLTYSGVVFPPGAQHSLIEYAREINEEAQRNGNSKGAKVIAKASADLLSAIQVNSSFSLDGEDKNRVHRALSRFNRALKGIEMEKEGMTIEDSFYKTERSEGEEKDEGREIINPEELDFT